MMNVRNVLVWTLATVLFATVPVATSGVDGSPVDATGADRSVEPTPALFDLDRMLGQRCGTDCSSSAYPHPADERFRQ